MTNERVLYDGDFLRLLARDHWEYVERSNARGAVIIVAVTDDERVLLVEQLRVPVGAKVIELPAGLVGDLSGFESESLAAAAARELEEETGYRPGRLEPLVDGPPSPALANEHMSFFRAYDLTRTGAGGGDDSEDIAVHAVPLREVDAWLDDKRGAGELVDPKVYTGLYFLRDLIPPDEHA